MPPNTTPIDLSAMAYAVNRIAQRVTGGRSIIFGPSTPIAPVNPDPRPRQWQYPVAINLANLPRRDMPDLTPFDRLRYLAKKHPLAALCIRVRSEQISALQWRVVARDKKAAGSTQEACDAVMQWWRKPDGITPLPAWLKALTRDILEIDAPTLYLRPQRGGGLHAAELIDGATIKPILDDWGRVAGYQQVLYGLPLSQYRGGAPVDPGDFEVINEMAPRDLWYQPYTPSIASPYGRPPMEDLIELAWTGINKINFDLGRFTDGNIPGALAFWDGKDIAPNVEQVGAFEDDFNATLLGDAQRGHKLKLIPFPMRIERLQELSTGGQYESAFEERMVKLFCATYGLTPAELGFTEDVNKSSGDSQQNVQYRIGIKPFAFWLKHMIFDPIIADRMGHPELEMVPDYGESEDQVMIAGVHVADIQAGVLTPQESRAMRYPDLEGPAPGPPAQPGAPPAPAAPAMLTTQKIAGLLDLRKEDDRPPDEPERLAAEAAAAALVGAFLLEQLDRLRKEIKGDPTRPLESFWQAEIPATVRAILPLWDATAAAAATQGAAQLVVGVEWGLVNSAALDLAQREAQRLAGELTATSQAQAAKIIAQWIGTGGPLEELTDRLALIYPAARAEMIGVTEITRIYAAGNRAAWQASGVVEGYRWQTARDDRVCPVCGPLQGSTYGIDDTESLPPAHPRCRCWVTPVIKD